MVHFEMEDRYVQTTYVHSPSRTSESWVLLGTKLPKAEIVFFSQIIILYIVIITCIVNLSIGNESEMWLILLSTSLGAILPNPDLKFSSTRARSVDTATIP